MLARSFGTSSQRFAQTWRRLALHYNMAFGTGSSRRRPPNPALKRRATFNRRYAAQSSLTTDAACSTLCPSDSVAR